MSRDQRGRGKGSKRKSIENLLKALAALSPYRIEKATSHDWPKTEGAAQTTGAWCLPSFLLSCYLSTRGAGDLVSDLFTHACMHSLLQTGQSCVMLGGLCNDEYQTRQSCILQLPKLLLSTNFCL